MARSRHDAVARLVLLLTPLAPPALATMSVVALLVVGGGVAVSGCGNDFDGLFVNGGDGGSGARATDAATDTTNAASDAGDGGSSPAVDGSATDGGSLACGAPELACTAPKPNVNNRIETGSCTGCGCTCPTFKCDGNEVETCNTTCSKGANCTVDCDIDKTCSLTAQAATSAKLTCSGKGPCLAACDQGGMCDVDCKNDSSCSLICGAGTSCKVHCGGNVTLCTVECPGGQKKDCQNGVFTCNRDCP